MTEWSTGGPGEHPEEVADQIHGVTTGPHDEAAEGTGAGDAQGASAGQGGGAGPGGRGDLFSRLADAGEDLIQRAAGMPGATRALEQAQTALARLDELQRRMSGVEALERRVAELEARVGELEGKAPGGRVDAIGFEA